MAVAELNVSRRALLGAVFAVPFIPAGGTVHACAGSSPRRGPGPSQTNWNGALARFRRAEAVLSAHAHDPDEDRYDALNGAFNRAPRRLLRTPAPDLPALSTKIDLAVDHEVAELTGGEACLAALARDARRLARSAV
jgi:hypothetical protein